MEPGTFPTKITTTDNEAYLERVMTQNADEVQLILVGNIIKKIPAHEIAQTEILNESLMYEGLLYDLDNKQIDALLDYLVSLSQ